MPCVVLYQTTRADRVLAERVLAQTTRADRVLAERVLAIRCHARFLSSGDWLQINGEAIYATRAMPRHWNDTISDYVRYTRSKVRVY